MPDLPDLFHTFALKNQAEERSKIFINHKRGRGRGRGKNTLPFSATKVVVEASCECFLMSEHLFWNFGKRMQTSRQDRYFLVVA